MLVSCLNNPKEDFLDFIKLISGSTTIEYNNAVAQSEKITVLNAALANFLKSFGNIENNVDEVLDFYFHQCSIEMNCQSLHSFFLANEGKTKDRVKF
jgi:glutaminase